MPNSRKRKNRTSSSSTKSSGHGCTPPLPSGMKTNGMSLELCTGPEPFNSVDLYFTVRGRFDMRAQVLPVLTKFNMDLTDAVIIKKLYIPAYDKVVVRGFVPNLDCNVLSHVISLPGGFRAVEGRWFQALSRQC